MIYPPEFGEGKRIRSYVCGKNVAVDVCLPDETCPIMSAGFVMNPNTFTAYYADHYILMQHYNPEQRGAVTSYVTAECTARSSRFFWEPKSPYEGAYSTRNIGIDNTPVSVQVPYGYMLRTYSDELWEEPLEDIMGDYINHLTQEPKCVILKN